MYKGIKLKICINGFLFDFFILFLFFLYINDLEDYLLDKNIIGLFIIIEGIEKEFFLYLKMFILFYVDDIVILVEFVNDL